MKTASISQAKNRLSAYVDLVRKGETVLITDRNTPVAQLVPLQPAANAGEEAWLRALERKGLIKRARLPPGKNFLRTLPRAPRVKGDALAALLAERKLGR